MKGELVEAKRNQPDLTSETTDSLKNRLTSLLAQTADDLRQMAAIVAELERRGEDMSELRIGIVDHLRRIAAGQLLPEIVVKFSGFPMMLRIAARLPIPDQQRLVADEPLDMAVWRGEQIEWRKVDPLALTTEQIRVVFADDRIRSQQEQVSILEQRAAKPDRKPATKRRRVRADRERMGVVVGRSFAPLDEVLAALAELRDVDYDDELNEESDNSIVVRLTTAEHVQLKTRAAKSQANMSQLARRALAAYGLIKGE